MAGYILAFSVYTLAMVGVIFIAFVVYRHAILNKDKNSKSTLKVEEMLNLNSRKTLYIIKVQNERYLIAADVDRTTFLAKLPDNQGISAQVLEAAVRADFAEEMPQTDDLSSCTTEKRSAMRNILKELTQKNR